MIVTTLLLIVISMTVWLLLWRCESRDKLSGIFIPSFCPLFPLKNSSSSEQNDTLFTDEAPSLLLVEGVPNLRDLGGYLTQQQDRTKTTKGRIFRSAHCGGMTEAGLARLKSMGIKFVVDLTSPEESTVAWVLTRPRIEEEGIRLVSCPMEKGLFSLDALLERYDSYKEDGAEAVARSYVALLSEGTGAVGAIVRIIIDNPDSGILLHCSLGKDRTGVISALLLLLAGVSDQDVARDYSLSSPGLAGCVGNIERYLVKAKGTSFDARQCALQMVNSREEYMLATLRHFREIFGTAERYFTSCGLSYGDVEALRVCLVGSEDE